MTGDAHTPRPLEGRRVLIVEDEYFQAREIAQTLAKAGADIIGPTAHADEVAGLLEGNAVDVAMLDINLGDGASFDVARSIRKRDIPFLFLTGYDVSIIPEDLCGQPRLEKPVNQAYLIERLVELVGAEA
ncbi:MAG: response regulator [Erythrobacter sp.]|jgi:DNA-binding LytR/AlgR family response regulator|nr:response regulator [Erythrobacter sp.]